MVSGFHWSTLLQLGVPIILGQRIFSYIYIYIFSNVCLFHSLVVNNHLHHCVPLYTAVNKCNYVKILKYNPFFD